LNSLGSTALIGIELNHVIAAAFGMHANQRRQGDALKHMRSGHV